MATEDLVYYCTMYTLRTHTIIVLTIDKIQVVEDYFGCHDDAPKDKVCNRYVNAAD